MLIGVRIQLTGLPLLPLVLFGPGWSVDDDLPTRPLKLDIRILRGQIGFKADDAIGRGIDDVVPPFWGHRPGSNRKREGGLVTKKSGRPTFNSSETADLVPLRFHYHAV